LRKVANRQADRQTDKQRRKHNLLGGGNNYEVNDILGMKANHASTHTVHCLRLGWTRRGHGCRCRSV